jgi:hypothetical protein
MRSSKSPSIRRRSARPSKVSPRSDAATPRLHHRLWRDRGVAIGLTEAEGLGSHADVNTVDAILDEVRRWHADVVVVGSRPHTWLADLRSEAVAPQMVERAGCSVLVAPLRGQTANLFGPRFE